jgi:hypothetical protein
MDRVRARGRGSGGGPLDAGPLLQTLEVHEEAGHDHPPVVDIVDLEQLAVRGGSTGPTNRRLHPILELPGAPDLVDHHHHPAVVEGVVGLDDPVGDPLDEFVSGLELLAVHGCPGSAVPGPAVWWRPLGIHPIMVTDLEALRALRVGRLIGRPHSFKTPSDDRAAWNPPNADDS